MKFKINDMVLFLNEKGQGQVCKIINKDTVAVAINDGFEIPYKISELILINELAEPIQPLINNPSPDTPAAIKLKPLNLKKEKEGIYTAFAPEKIDDIPNSNINVWLINNTDYKLLYTYSLLQTTKFNTLASGIVKPYESLLIETIERKKLNDFSTFKIEALFFNEESHEHQAPISEIIKFRSIKLYKENAFAKNNFIQEKAFVLNVFTLNNNSEPHNYHSNLDLSKILFHKKEQQQQPQKSKPHVSNNAAYEMEINLHIEDLMDNYNGMSNAEIILVQLKFFQAALDKAINERFRKLIIIHGVGNGRLKQEVLTILKPYSNLIHYDASYSKYGFGATEILFK